ncbi:hypothetical protein HBI65_136630 [Parastagonospora nodorum]|nr:hypothetical protein HBI65_136630 [Parastagonospora nodorum]
MLLGKGYTWKTAKTRLPPSRQLLHSLRNPRFLSGFGLFTLFIVLWRSLSPMAGEVQRSRFSCFGPSKPPMRMSANEAEDWHAHMQTPVIFNHHTPVEINETEVQYVNLNGIDSTIDAVRNKERMLIVTPLKDASKHLATHFDLLVQLTYPHELIDLAFLVGDTSDDTLAILAMELERIQTNPDVRFRSTMIVQKDFGVNIKQEVKDRHKFENQGPRRKAMGRARNYLLATALKPEHSWVYWRDVDIVDSPKSIIEDFIAHDRDVLVPNVWFHRYEKRHGEVFDIEGRFDYNSWQESPQGLALAATLPKSVVLAEGYKQFPTNRKYMALTGDPRANKDEEMPLDGIGGVNIIVKADVHRSGINFPAYAFENQAETEGFAKMAKRAGYGVYGLPNYIVWHVDTEEKPGNV